MSNDAVYYAFQIHGTVSLRDYEHGEGVYKCVEKRAWIDRPWVGMPDNSFVEIDSGWKDVVEAKQQAAIRDWKEANAEVDVAKKIDWSKPVQTKDGYSVRVLCLDARGGHPVHGLVATYGPAGKQSHCSWTMDGFALDSNSPSHMDVVNVPPEPVVRWVNVYALDVEPAHFTCGPATYVDADRAKEFKKHDCVGNSKYVATVRVEFTPK